jgi:hypothetical protein
MEVKEQRTDGMSGVGIYHPKSEWRGGASPLLLDTEKN